MADRFKKRRRCDRRNCRRIIGVVGRCTTRWNYFCCAALRKSGWSAKKSWSELIDWRDESSSSDWRDCGVVITRWRSKTTLPVLWTAVVTVLLICCSIQSRRESSCCETDDKICTGSSVISAESWLKRHVRSIFISPLYLCPLCWLIWLIARRKRLAARRRRK